MKSLLRATDFQLMELNELFEVAADMDRYLDLNSKGYKIPDISQMLTGKIMGTLFLEPSTRTRLSFEVAMQRLGGSVVSVSESISSSCKKGESIKDAIKTVSQYVDALVVRCNVPIGTWGGKFDSHVINGGDDANEHPTQALVDAYTIHKNFGTLENLNVAFVGDLKKGRTVHSLIRLMRRNGNSAYLFGSKIPDPYIGFGNNVVELQSNKEFVEILPHIDVLYMTRMQKERGTTGEVPFVLTNDLANIMSSDAIIMHPMPRLKELPPVLDNNPRSVYFEQSKNGVPVRMAILRWIFGV